MTLIEVIDRARFMLNSPLASTRTFPDNTSTFWQDTHLQGYFNMVQQDVSLELFQTFEDFLVTQTSLNISACQADYALPTDFVKMRYVEDIRNDNPIEIYPIALEQQNRGADLYSRSATIWGGGYYLRGNRIVFDITPAFTQASAVRLTYVPRVADVTASTNSSTLPDEWHPILSWGITRMALIQAQSDATYVTREYERLMNLMKKQGENRQIQRPRYVLQNKGEYF